MKNKKLKAGMRVCHVNLPTFYGVLTEDVKKGYPALVKLDPSNQSYPSSVNIYSIKSTKLRQCTKEDMLRLAIYKMEKAKW